jgi:hypothetical protein
MIAFSLERLSGRDLGDRDVPLPDAGPERSQGVDQGRRHRRRQRHRRLRPRGRQLRDGCRRRGGDQGRPPLTCSSAASRPGPWGSSAPAASRCRRRSAATADSATGVPVPASRRSADRRNALPGPRMGNNSTAWKSQLNGSKSWDAPNEP